MLVRPDGCAEYRLTKNVVSEHDNEGNDVIQGKEVYFEVAAGQLKPTVKDVTANFERYWSSGIEWPANASEPTTEERIAALETENLTALEAVAELYEMMMP